MGNNVASPVRPSPDDEQLQPNPSYNPSIEDVIRARNILTSVGTRTSNLPMEIALMILSHASYRPRQPSTKYVEKTYNANQFWSPGPSASVAGLYLLAPTWTVPAAVARPRSITFRMKSADQGWATFGGDGTYDNSHTWYETSILRPVPKGGDDTLTTVARPTSEIAGLEEVPNFRTPGLAREYLHGYGWDMVKANVDDDDDDDTVVWRVHNNITACREHRDYEVEWVVGVPTEVVDPRAMGDGKGFLETLRPGDVVALWARAEQQAWENRIKAASIEIEYEVL